MKHRLIAPDPLYDSLASERPFASHFEEVKGPQKVVDIFRKNFAKGVRQVANLDYETVSAEAVSRKLAALYTALKIDNPRYLKDSEYQALIDMLRDSDFKAQSLEATADYTSKIHSPSAEEFPPMEENPKIFASQIIIDHIIPLLEEHRVQAQNNREERLAQMQAVKQEALNVKKAREEALRVALEEEQQRLEDRAAARQAREHAQLVEDTIAHYQRVARR